MRTPELLSDPVYHDETAARFYLEANRWPDFISCPLCGSVEKISRLAGESVGPGWWFCGACKDKFTVRVGTVMERSHIPLHKWLLAFRLMASSKKGVSAHQLHRTLGITYKSAWFLAHRIREAMVDTDPTPIGGDGKIIESDETWYGKNPNAPEAWVFKNEQGWKKRRPGTSHLLPILTVIERGGKSRSVRLPDMNSETTRRILLQRADRNSTLMTDERTAYRQIGKRFAGHESVNHKDEEYVRGPAHVNSAEGFFSIFKRGMRGIYQHCSEDHLHRYLAEFDFRYSNRAALRVDDILRTMRAIRGAEGTRLT